MSVPCALPSIYFEHHEEMPQLSPIASSEQPGSDERMPLDNIGKRSFQPKGNGDAFERCSDLFPVPPLAILSIIAGGITLLNPDSVMTRTSSACSSMISQIF